MLSYCMINVINNIAIRTMENDNIISQIDWLKFVRQNERLKKDNWDVLKKDELNEEQFFKLLFLCDIQKEQQDDQKEILDKEAQLNNDFKKQVQSRLFNIFTDNSLNKSRKQIALIKWLENKNGYVYKYQLQSPNLYILLDITIHM